jgi:hypothetical protein
MGSIPDFTKPEWHRARSNDRLVHSISEGKGKGTAMPSFRGKLRDEQVRELVGYLRSIAPELTRSNPRSTAEFHRRFQQLREQMDQLDRQYRALSSQERTARKQPADKQLEMSE